MTNKAMNSIVEIENKDHIEQVMNHIQIVMSQISDQTTTWNYLNGAFVNLKTVLEAVYK